MTNSSRLDSCRDNLHILRHESEGIISLLESAITAFRAGKSPTLDFERIRRFQETYDSWQLQVSEIIRESKIDFNPKNLSLENAENVFRSIDEATAFPPEHRFVLNVLDWAEQIRFSENVNSQEVDLFRERIREAKKTLQHGGSSDDIIACLRVYRLHSDRTLLPTLVSQISSGFSSIQSVALAVIVGEPSCVAPKDADVSWPCDISWPAIETFVKNLRAPHRNNVSKEIRDAEKHKKSGDVKDERQPNVFTGNVLSHVESKNAVPSQNKRLSEIVGKMLQESIPSINPVSSNKTELDTKPPIEELPEVLENANDISGPAVSEEASSNETITTSSPNDSSEVKSGELETSSEKAVDERSTPSSLADIPSHLKNARQAAEECRIATAEHEREKIQYLVWLLLQEHRIGLAYYLALYLEEKYAESDFPKELLETMAICPGIAGITDPLIDRYHMKIDKASDFLNQATRPACLDVLILSTLIWPALTASKTVVLNQLEKLNFSKKFVEFEAVRNELRQLGNIPFLERIFRFDPKIIDQEQLLRDLREKTEYYLNQHSQATLKFPTASKILHSWVTERGPIGSVLRRLLTLPQSDYPTAVKELERFAKNWDNQGFVEMQIHEANTRFRKNPDTVVGSPKNSLLSAGREASRLVTEWIRIQGMSNVNIQIDRVLESRRKIQSAMAHCRESVQLETMENRCDQVVLNYVFHVFDELDQVFSTTHETFEYGNEKLVDLQMNAELLFIPGIELNENGSPTFLNNDEYAREAKKLEDLKTIIVEHVATTSTGHDVLSSTDWPSIIKEHICQKNYSTPNIILDFLELPGWMSNESFITEKDGAPFDPAACRKYIEKRLTEEQCKLQERKKDIAARITFSRHKGFLEEDDRQRLNQLVDRILPTRTLRIDLAEVALDEVGRELDECRMRSIEITRRELEEWTEREKYPNEFRQICDIAENGDILRAFDLFNVLKNEKELPTLQPTLLPGLDFFPEFMAKTTALFSARELQFNRFVQQFENWKGEIADRELKTTIFPKDSRAAAEILRIWNSQRQQWKDFDPAAIKRILEYLGFRVNSIEKIDKNHLRMRLERPLGDRNDCILKDFGSDCKDGYDLLCLREQKTAETIIEESKRLDLAKRPVIILYFRPMSPARRIELNKMLRKPNFNNLRLLVLDDVLMVYLCLCRNKLLSFFNAASQLSPAEPFTNTAGIVPIEMFFGREKEVDKIVDMNKSSLVYGGRQLGKTVLLRYVEQREHDPDRGRIVLFINLKDFRDEIERETSAIWSIIAQSLAPFKIVGTKVQTARSVRQGINDWLDEAGKQDRTILLLLDEADLFLRRDAEDSWRQLDSFNAMMTEKERRFKVVFAGLHDVCRTTVASNSPIAHLQDPVCIGPFLRREEIADAMRMIKYPFEAMGYRFKDDDLIGSILAQVNYYPSLIQIFCMKLLESIKFRNDLSSAIPNAGIETPPPYLITEKEVERVFGNKDFQHEICERFRFTLRLDNRYFVIALTLALEYLRTRIDRFFLRDILELAREWWPEGFNEKEHQLLIMESLLHEMTDLGVLREVGDQYFFRNANVIRLLGTEERIETELLDAITNKDLFKTADPLTFRRRLDRTQPWKRMPLIRPQRETKRKSRNC